MGNKKTKIQKAKEPIKVRFKTLANGNKSIYLDYYKDGKREYEFLKLYLIPEATSADKETNNETLRLANAVKSKKIVELQNNAHGFTNGGTRSSVNVIEYIKALAENRRIKAGGGSRTVAMGYLALARHIETYSGKKNTFKQIDKAYCLGFIEYLKTAKNRRVDYKDSNGLSANSQFMYFRTLNTVFNCAIFDNVINSNPLNHIKQENKPKRQTAEVCFLTIEEVELLSKTRAVSIVKNSFLFSCYTGLRFSDISRLVWGQLQKDNNGGTFISYIQKKTKKQEYLPIAQKAIQYLPERPAEASDGDLVFNMPCNVYVNSVLKKWVKDAGISKNVTFHVARHTNATLLLSLEVPIETVSKMLGHADIQTTQIYAKVIDKSKLEAVRKLDGLMD